MMDIEKAMRQAEVSLGLEGFNIKEEQKKIVKSLLKNEITEQEFQKRIRDMLK